ncbi:MAG: hypothetical protein IPF99_19880 [Deltaproteobacteria bacterium]|nr:hypothetical protein [Deltaproteobacteria bacterium]
MNDLYVFNNPWSVQANEKHTSYCAMMALGMPIPETWMIPPKSYEPSPDVRPTLQRYAKLFDVGKVGAKVGYPAFLKPYDGGGWRAVTRVTNEKTAWKAYEESGKAVMHMQAGVKDYDRFMRCIGFGPQAHVRALQPRRALHDRYTMEQDFIAQAEGSPAQDHPDDQRLLRVGVQLVRVAARQRRVVPHRLRQPVPRLAGDVAALPLPVAGEVPELVDLLRGDEAQDAQDLDWEPFYAIAAEATCYAEKSGATPRQTPRALRHRARFRGRVLRDAPRALPDEVAKEFFATPRGPRAGRPRGSPRSFPPTRSSLGPSPSVLGGGSRSGAKTTRRAGARGRSRSKSRLRGGSRVWSPAGAPPHRKGEHPGALGHLRAAGAPAPTAGRRRGDRALADDRRCCGRSSTGRIKVYACDSVAGRALVRQKHQMWLQNQFHQYVRHEVVPAVRMDCKAPDIELWTAGARRRLHAAARVCRFPDVFARAIGLSGTFDLRRFFDCPMSAFNDDFRRRRRALPSRRSGRHLELFRTLSCLCGEGRAEDIGESWALAKALGAQGVPNRVISWGPEWPHDWDTWRHMLPQYLDEWTRDREVGKDPHGRDHARTQRGRQRAGRAGAP